MKKKILVALFQKSYYPCINKLPPKMKHLLVSLMLLAIIVTCAKPKEESPQLEQTTINILKQKPSDGVILDVRTPQEFSKGHVQGAVNLDFLAEPSEELKGLDKNQKYYVYCAGGVRSGKMVTQMKEMGFSKLVDLNDGFSSWEGPVSIN